LNIFIVEDELRTANYLRKGLIESGFNVSVAHDGIEGLLMIKEKLSELDLILLDITLPGISGWEVAAQIRTVDKLIPIIFLTARDSLEDKVRGFDLGADDYLVKPFSFAELLVRIKSQLRRKNECDNVLMYFDLKVDLLKRKVFREGVQIKLTAKEFLLLEVLLNKQGQILTKTFLASNVWDINFDCGSNVIEVAIRRLRKKIDDPFDRKLIQTVRSMGYVLESVEE
tara:strand:- start:801 stop:1481 length:681 start_codon:yes stop_codon:yes gene_type:complete